MIFLFRHVDQHSVLSITTHYWLDGAEIENRWGRDFSHTSRPVLGSTQPALKRELGLFPGGKMVET